MIMMKTRHFKQLPKAYWAYPKVIQRALHTPTVVDPQVAQIEYVVNPLQIDPVHLAKYKQICAYPSDGLVPATYLAVLSQNLQMHMMTREQFPLPILGLVHLRNRIRQYRPVQIHEILQLSCRFAELEQHAKGIQFEFVVSAKVNGELVFEGYMTYLSKHKQPSATATSTASSVAEAPPAAHYQPLAQWQLAQTLGLQYARISGDFNLIHLHALTAKVFGFKRAIAHGMWTKARVLAALGPLPKAYQADVWFKLPVYLPSTVELLTEENTAGTSFLLRNPTSHKPHLSGELSALR
jgi:acyl dehydratase